MGANNVIPAVPQWAAAQASFTGNGSTANPQGVTPHLAAASGQFYSFGVYMWTNGPTFSANAFIAVVTGIGTSFLSGTTVTLNSSPQLVTTAQATGLLAATAAYAGWQAVGTPVSSTIFYGAAANYAPFGYTQITYPATIAGNGATMTTYANWSPGGPGQATVVPTVAQLNQLSSVASFVVNQSVRPTWHFYNKAVQIISANWQVMQFTKVAYDCDGVFSSNGVAKIVTQGFYATECCIEFGNLGGNARIQIAVAFLITGGTNNPHLGSGAKAYYGFRATQSANAGGDEDAITCCDVTPFCLYPGDTVSVIVTIGTLSAFWADYLENVGTMIARFSANFTGYLCNTGT